MDQIVPHISVVIPVFREEDCLKELYTRLIASIGTITDHLEIVFVEDAGGDGSWDVIAGLAAADSRVKGIRFTRNFGQHCAISAGLDHVRGDWIVVMDADLQDPPEAIPSLYQKALEGFHVVAALRDVRADSWSRRFLSAQFSRVFSFMTGMEYDTRIGVLRILSRRTVQAFRRMPEKQRFFAGIINWLGFPSATVLVEHGSRFAGSSGYNLRRLLSLAFGVIISYTDRPLRFSVILGLIMSLSALMIGAYIVFFALFFDRPVEGWASVMVSIYLLCGLIIGNIGIVGLYLGRVFEEVKNRPNYVVLDEINLAPAAHTDHMTISRQDGAPGPVALAGDRTTERLETVPDE